MTDFNFGSLKIPIETIFRLLIFIYSLTSMYDHFMSDHCLYRQTNFLVSWFEDCPICLWPLVSDCLMRAQISLFSVCAHYWYLEHSTAFQWHSGTSCIVSALERGTPCGLILMHWAVLSKIAFIFYLLIRVMHYLEMLFVCF